MRRGMSLIEVTIALAIFAVLMAAALECFGGVRRYVDQEGAQNDLVLEGRRVLATVIADVGNSAWFIPLDGDGDGVQRPPTGADVNDLDDLANPARDRALRYYPYVNVQAPAGLGAAFPLHARLPADVVDVAAYPAALPPDHRLPSQELIFLKVRTGAVAPTVAATEVRRVNFNDEVVPIAARTLARDGVPVDSVQTATSGSGLSALVSDIPLAWETHLATADNSDVDDLREHTYVLVPNPRTGRGRLERRYRNGGGAMALDRVVSDDVDRIVFDTYRTAPGLNVNQVRVTIWLSREYHEQPGLYQCQRIEATMALRSTVDPEYSLNLGGWLGSGGSFGVP
ncbi:MAG TPA: prepilin-type N-terminal cleavage/methylation domain-containing protein [Planctomycetota bacterium]|nr:prepilin-type N-terminal cleavage/methylation domain-containing protein [Planctomycetota bacterium]